VGSAEIRVKDVYMKALYDACEVLVECFQEICSTPTKNGGICLKKVGQYLRSNNRRIEGGYRAVRSGSYQNADTWRVEKIN
jgi:hypothetical protein